MVDILVRANMDPDLKENQRMSDAEGTCPPASEAIDLCVADP